MPKTAPDAVLKIILKTGHKREPRTARNCLLSMFLLSLLTTGCRRNAFPDVPDGYREFAYVSNGGANTVSVLDLVYLRSDRTLQVGVNPSGMAVNSVRNEVYVVNTGLGSQVGSVSVIDAGSNGAGSNGAGSNERGANGGRSNGSTANSVVATIPVHRLPYFIAVEPSGHRAFVANSGSNTVSVLDLDRRREIAVAGTGEQPGLAQISPDGRSLVVTNRGGGSISIFAVERYTPNAYGPQILQLRGVFSGCPGATDAVILPDSSKVFVACSSGHQVMAVAMAAEPGSWPARQDSAALADHLLAFLDVGLNPVHLALKPDGGEVFSSNVGSNSVSEISTWTNEVTGTFPIGDRPVHGIVSRDNATLWVSNFGADSISIYSIDDGRLVSSVRTGSAPDALAFSADEHLLLAADAHSGDIAVIRTKGQLGPTLFTTLPAGPSPNAIVVKATQARR